MHCHAKRLLGAHAMITFCVKCYTVLQIINRCYGLLYSPFKSLLEGDGLWISDSNPTRLQHDIRLRKVAGVTESYHEFSCLLYCDKSGKHYVSDTETSINEST